MTAHNIYDGINPYFFNLPSKFESFRPEQLQALEYAVFDCHKPFTAISLSTGSGKSLFGVALARALGCKAVYLTATRNLQDQVIHDFAECGMADVRGRANYRCGQIYPSLRYQPSCDYGHLHGCSLENSLDCRYTAAVRAGEQADLIVTNYAYWMYARRYKHSALATEDKPVELLICDEIGDAADLISAFVSIEIKHADEELPYSAPHAGQDRPSGLMPDATWVTWAVERRVEATRQMARVRESYLTAADAMKDDRYVYLKELITLCDRIPQLDSNWVWEVDGQGVKFEPIWPGQMASALWSGVPRILLMSATLRPYTLGLLGIKKDDYDFREWPSTFPPQYGPVYYLPTVKLTWRSDAMDYTRMWEQVDQCLDLRNDRRTLIHTGSYGRSKMIAQNSRHKERMIFNENGRDAAACAQQFREGPDNAVLVGPSYTTGVDFPGRDCEFQIIVKTPYPDTSRRVMAERCNNGDYRMHCTVQKLVQMAGRPRRSRTDRAETVILDDGVKWAMGGPRNPWHGHAPAHFRVQEIRSLPPAPARMKI